MNSAVITGRRCFAVCLLCLLMFGCAESPFLDISEDPEAEALWQSREVSLRGINGWAVKGRLGITTSKEGWTASLHWAQQKQLYMMRIMAPLGQGTYEIKGGHGKVSLLTEQNELIEAADPDTLMNENLGWSVPVLGLQHWILGIPAPHSPVQHRAIDGDGRLVSLEQDGWKIIFSRYQSVGQYELPGKISMENSRIKVRLAIQDWVKII